MKQRLDAIEESRIHQLSRRHVDCDPSLRPTTMMPFRGLFDGRLQYPIANLDNEPGLLCDTQKLIRQAESPIGSSPTQERFDQADPQCLQINLRLIEELEFPALYRMPQPLFDVETSGRPGDQYRRKHRQLATAQRFRLKESGVGCAE